ncbi:hypothetical protein D3C86_1347890 [compost metagenome]
MEVGYHHVSDFFRRSTRSYHPLAYQGIEHIHTRNAWTRLEVTHTSIDHDNVASCVHYPKLNGDQQFVHVLNPVIRRHQIPILLQHAIFHGWEQERWIMSRTRVLKNTGNFNISDHAGLHHGTTPQHFLLVAATPQVFTDYLLPAHAAQFVSR